MNHAVVKYTTQNIGDDMQSLAASRFLPGSVSRLDRDRMDNPLLLLRRYRLILNGWFMKRPEHWPPVRTIDPLVISYHMNVDPDRVKTLLSGKSLDWFRRQAAKRGVGTRDLNTMRLFREAGVDAYFSGCLTMTMRPPAGVARTDELLMIDVAPDAEAKLRAATKQGFEKLTQIIPTDTAQPERLRLVEERFRRLCGAKAVATSRIHVAFPCLAVGVPVLFVHSALDGPRMVGIVEHLHTTSPADVAAERYDFSFDDPPPNKNTHLEMAREMERRCEAFVAES